MYAVLAIVFVLAAGANGLVAHVLRVKGGGTEPRSTARNGGWCAFAPLSID